MPATAVYYRVSTLKQDEKSQVPDVERWIKNQPEGTTIVPYKDKFTGLSFDRPGWNALWQAVEAGEIDRIVVWRLDRLGRMPAKMIELFAELQTRKIRLVSLTEGFDLSTPQGVAMASLLAVFAKLETETRRERIAAGISKAKAEGKPHGRKGGVHTPVKVAPEKTELIRKLKAEGKTPAAIARMLDISRPTVYAHLRGLGS